MELNMKDYYGDEMFEIISDFFEKVKNDRLQHEVDCINKYHKEKIELHTKLYDKQKRYANDKYVSITFGIQNP